MKVLITGGSGFLGRAILRQVQQNKLDWKVTVYSRDETKQDECKRRYPFANYVLGDVKDFERLCNAMTGNKYVIHAAAMKYIPEAELNAAECISVNVDGARNIIRAAKLVSSVEKVVGISTDKAVGPVNIYGASKMVMERLFADESRFCRFPSFACVRYGNVIGSTGSVIPLFQRQYQETGKVKITNPNMTRFWMGVDEAIDLIHLSLNYGRPGTVMIPTVRAMKLIDVAKAATMDDVEVEIIGERPGEKIHESLLHFEESVRVYQNADPLYYELFPPGSNMGKEAFTLASHNPHVWMTVEEMRALIEDSKEV